MANPPASRPPPGKYALANGPAALESQIVSGSRPLTQPRVSEITKAVFLSYASQDVAAALGICAALRAGGIEVWFDQDALVGGDTWDQKIRGQIGACALFMPVISVNTQARQEGYFRLEWKLAEDRSFLMVKGKAFILPVTVDETNERGALVPDAFRAVQWTKLPGGETSAAIVARVQKLLAPASEVEPGRPRPVERDEGVASPTNASVVGRRVPAAAWSVAAILATVVISFLGWRRAPDSTPIAAPNPGAGSRPPTAEKSAPAALVINAKSIAVLPFENLSDDKTSGYFADGVQEDIIAILSFIRDLKVVPRPTAMRYRASKRCSATRRTARRCLEQTAGRRMSVRRCGGSDWVGGANAGSFKAAISRVDT